MGCFQLNIWIVIKQSTIFELNEPIDEVVMNVKRLTHSQQHTDHQRERQNRSKLILCVVSVLCAST